MMDCKGDMTEPDLTRRLETCAFEMSNGVSLERRLMRAFLSEQIAASVLREYRRFLILALTQPGPVVPSPLLREVWSLHASDRPVWASFRDTVLQQPMELTHPGQPERNDSAYAETLALYSRVFAEKPPGLCWPPQVMLHLRRWAFVPVVLAILWALAGATMLGVAHVVSGMLLLVACLVWNAAFVPLRLGWQEEDALERR